MKTKITPGNQKTTYYRMVLPSILEPVTQKGYGKANHKL